MSFNSLSLNILGVKNFCRSLFYAPRAKKSYGIYGKFIRIVRMGKWNTILFVSYAISFSLSCVLLYTQFSIIPLIEALHVLLSIFTALLASCSKQPYWTFFLIEFYWSLLYLLLLFYIAFNFSWAIFIGVLGFLRAFALGYKAFHSKTSFEISPISHSTPLPR